MDCLLLPNMKMVKLFRNSRDFHLSQLIWKFHDRKTTLNALLIVLNA